MVSIVKKFQNLKNPPGPEQAVFALILKIIFFKELCLFLYMAIGVNFILLIHYCLNWPDLKPAESIIPKM